MIKFQTPLLVFSSLYLDTLVETDYSFLLKQMTKPFCHMLSWHKVNPCSAETWWGDNGFVLCCHIYIYIYIYIYIHGENWMTLYADHISKISNVASINTHVYLLQFNNYTSFTYLIYMSGDRLHTPASANLGWNTCITGYHYFWRFSKCWLQSEIFAT